MTYGLREPLKKEVLSIGPQSPVLLVLFTKQDLEVYIRQKTKGLTTRSVNWILQITKIIFDVTRGELTLDTLDRLSNAFHEKYSSDRSRAKCFIYTRNFLKWLYKIKMDQQLLPLLATFEQPKVRTPKRLTTRIVTIDDVRSLITHIEHDRTLTEAYRQNFLCQVLFLSYTGQRPLTMARIDREQIVQTLTQSPPVLTVRAEQDKIRLEHYVPVHPVLISLLKGLIDNTNGSMPFHYEALYKYLRKVKIPLSKTDGQIQLKDLRKFFEQKSDDIGFTDANKNFIMSHGVSSVNWQSYKQFLPETVYENYIEKWGCVRLETDGYRSYIN